MTVQLRYTSADLEELPDIPGVRYEVIDGSLHVSKATRWEHEHASFELAVALREWSLSSGTGQVILTPGLIFAPEQDVIPDMIWISYARMAALVDEGGHFRGAPELMVEVLSPGRVNEQRDREVKLSLYSRQGVQEYWIVDWRTRTVELYRRDGAELRLVATLRGEASITLPLFPGFSCPTTNLCVPFER
jgi:Uma2 family endonuclease